MPVRTFENLSHLDIFLGQDMENITLIFRYAGRLESLSILGLDNRAIFPLFEDHPNSLPSLRYFKIMSPYREWQPDVDIGEAQFLSLSRFLCGKKELRALDIHLWSQGWPSHAPFWDLLRQLPTLETLGITTGVGVFTQADFLSFATALPPRLSALRVCTQWDLRGGEENDGCRTFVRTICLSVVEFARSKHYTSSDRRSRQDFLLLYAELQTLLRVPLRRARLRASFYQDPRVRPSYVLHP